ncbi:hypothetical protein FRZ03_28750 [Streptomyces misionensis]|uniref:Uncharacterized protein n=1 Tax=Streptomyces misionensis TaxID=67331 RepID=A0A5C6IZ90_9ACTN|nr:hypothetical protein FRZ03_28750 [Streptomyces misionensis]
MGLDEIHQGAGQCERTATRWALVPIALTALAYRTRGWAPAVRSGYLPHPLVTGFGTRGPRVAAFGRDRRPDAVAALAAASDRERGRAGARACPCSREGGTHPSAIRARTRSAAAGRPSGPQTGRASHRVLVPECPIVRHNRYRVPSHSSPGAPGGHPLEPIT